MPSVTQERARLANHKVDAIRTVWDGSQFSFERITALVGYDGWQAFNAVMSDRYQTAVDAMWDAFDDMSWAEKQSYASA